MTFAATDMIALLSAHTYEVLLPLSIAEGPIVTIAGGFLVATGHLEALPVFGIVVLGDLIGDAALRTGEPLPVDAPHLGPDGGLVRHHVERAG